ncbi:MAG: ABC transporter permease [Deltaproteobacteria bacterium]|jgi:ABC-type dipeptide/oligopeptide/nickel transport system permease component|nr:ABC transporter permease [Deltaproteobacteria bacterium]MDP3038575.1 ABC transporter permease [Deltaproteobacteria bacterium]
MGIYLLRRLYQAILVLLVVSGIVFVILHISGDPLALLMPQDAPPSDIEEMRRSLGLDKPLIVQYGLFLKNAAQGNLGVSYHHGQPALKLVLERLPASLELVVTTILISLILAVPIGVLAASRRGTTVDRASLLGSLIGISAPPFWIGIVFILIFSVELQWLPSSGRGTWAHLILPAGSLALYRLALFIRLIRAGMLDIMTMDFIRTARSKGVSEQKVIYKHALKNTLIPFVTIAGMQMGSLLAGAIVTEKVFAWPGMGRLFLEAIGVMDFPVIIAWALVTSTIFLTVNLAVDIIYVWLDPRIRHEK